MDWNKINKIYMIGIKGVGMTMLAQYLANNGKRISGSDVAESFMTDLVLQKIRADIKLGFVSNNVPNDVDLIIYSSAYNDNNPEVAGAKAGQVKTMSYGEALADCFNQSYGIAISGSHGKTTTTAWLGYVLWKSGLEPNVLVGATVPQFAGSTITGKSNYLVIEADEYQNKFLLLNPKIILLNNIDYDHPDFFPTQDSYVEAFAQYLTRLPKSGKVIANFDDEIVSNLVEGSGQAHVSYSINESVEAELKAVDIKSAHGQQYFKVMLDGEALGDFVIQMPGLHNISNALAVIATCLELNIELHAIRTHLEGFTGTSRRMQKLGVFEGAVLYDDYAHHPTEIRASIQAIKQLYPEKKLTVVFHPHTFTRTKALFADFTDSFSGVDRLIILDIYGSAREIQGGASSQELVATIREKNTVSDVIYLPGLSDVVSYLRQQTSADELIVLMGAGDVFRVGESLLND